MNLLEKPWLWSSSARIQKNLTFAIASLMSFVVCISFETFKSSEIESGNTYPKMINLIHLIYNKTEISNA